MFGQAVEFDGSPSVVDDRHCLVQALETVIVSDGLSWIVDFMRDILSFEMEYGRDRLSE